MSGYDGGGDHFNDCSGIGGCDCDERRYGPRGSGGGGGSNKSIAFLIAVIVCSFIGAWNELIGGILMIIVAVILLTTR